VTAHQIRRLTGQNESYLFDWICTAGQSFSFLLIDDQPFLAQGNWEIVDEGLRLRDKYSGLAFQHEFGVVDGKIDAAKVDEQLDEVRNKFLHLKAKFLGALKSAQRPVVVRAESSIVSLDQAAVALDDMRNVFSKINACTRFVVASSNLSDERVTDQYLFVRVKESAVAGVDAWKGDDESWRRLVALAEGALSFGRQA
jgi:hypothetical protein